MGKYFGTDGFRGEANVTLNASQAFEIGRFLGYHYAKNGKKPRAVIGKDTRLSGYMLEYAIASGLCSQGVQVYLLHVTTTPSVSYIIKQGGFDFGIMITASHNPYYDNGIKVLDKNGQKLSEEITDKIEHYLDNKTELPPATGSDIGAIFDYQDGIKAYICYLTSLGKRLDGYKIGLDLANGGGYKIAREVFSALGAEVIEIGNAPNGLNINKECGSTHIKALCSLVKEKGLDLAFALDGDGDRCIAVDENGSEVDGDFMLYILARALKQRGELALDTLVLTVMSNSGLIKSLEKIGISTVCTQVGDRFVYECMEQNGYTLGGEQSGHIIIKKHASTGDGILTAIMIANELVASKKSLSELCKGVYLYPQISSSVKVQNKERALKNRHVQAVFDDIEAEIAGQGRVLLRPSGTESVIRIMVECENAELCKEYVKRLEKALKESEYD